jgi:hypothetical protein
VVTRLAGVFVAVGLWLTCTSCQQDAGNAQKVAGEQVVAADTAGAPKSPGALANIRSFTLRWRAGEVFRYRIEQVSEGGPDTARTYSTSTHWYTRTVRAVRSDGSFETVVRFDSIVVTGSVKNTRAGVTLMEQSYRSADTAEATRRRFPQFASIIGEDVVVYMSTNGRVEQVGDVAPIVKKISALAGQPLSPQMSEQLTEQVKTGVYAAFMLQEFVPYPEQGLDSNASWVNDQVSPLSEIFTVATKASYALGDVYEVRGQRIGVIGATVAGAVQLRPLPPNAPMSIIISASSINGSSTSVIDVDRGITLAKRNSISMSMTAQVRAPGGQRQELSQSQSSVTTIELLR